MENINYLTTPGAGNTFKLMWRRNGDFLSALCRWCSSPDDSLLLPWILRLYKMICARTFTGNEKPGSSRLLPSMSRFSKRSNSQGRGDSSINDPLNSFFTFFSLIQIALDIVSIISYSVRVFKSSSASFPP